MEKRSGFLVYWLHNNASQHQHFDMDKMLDALTFMESLRNTEGNEFVGMVSQNPNSVGKSGVSDKLPSDYSWSKQHRAGGKSKDDESYGIGSRSNGY